MHPIDFFLGLFKKHTMFTEEDYSGVRSSLVDSYEGSDNFLKRLLTKYPFIIIFLPILLGLGVKLVDKLMHYLTGGDQNADGEENMEDLLIRLGEIAFKKKQALENQY